LTLCEVWGGERESCVRSPSSYKDRVSGVGSSRNTDLSRLTELERGSRISYDIDVLQAPAATELSRPGLNVVLYLTSWSIAHLVFTVGQFVGGATHAYGEFADLCFCAGLVVEVLFSTLTLTSYVID